MIAQADETGCFGFRLATRTEIPRCSIRRDLPGLIAAQIDISRPIDDRTDQAVEPAEHEMPLPVPTEARMDKCCPVELLAAVLAVRYASQPYGTPRNVASMQPLVNTGTYRAGNCSIRGMDGLTFSGSSIRAANLAP